MKIETTIAPKWEMFLARLLGARVRGHEDGHSITAYQWRGIMYVADVSEDPYASIVRDLVRAVDAYEGRAPAFACQGQAMDGYSALAEFVEIARRARSVLTKFSQNSYTPPCKG